MKRPRRDSARDITAVERAWAAGEPISLDDRGELEFFTPRERLEHAFEVVNGETLDAWLLRSPDVWQLGVLEWNGVQVRWLEESDLALLAAGIPLP